MNKRRYYNKKNKPAAKNTQSGATPQPSENANNLKAKDIVPKYDNFLNQYIMARKKFFEAYYRAPDAKLDQIERNYRKALDELTRYTFRLSPWQKEVLEKRTECYPLDSDYSSKHGISLKGEPDADLPLNPDYHATVVQIKRPSYKDDKEATIGTEEDYIQYKNSK